MSSTLKEAEAAALVDPGLQASRANDAASAIEGFNEASALLPLWAVPHFLVGAELAQAGRVVPAEAAYANAVLLDPGFQMARYQLGLLQFSSGRAAMALVTWEPLLGIGGAAPLQRFVHGFAALAQDAFQEALECFREGLLLQTGNEPLAGDVRKLIEAIERLGTAAATGEIPSDPSRSSAGACIARTRREDIHVLLANYSGKPIVH